jgi:hypothetical protein
MSEAIATFRLQRLALGRTKYVVQDETPFAEDWDVGLICGDLVPPPFFGMDQLRARIFPGSQNLPNSITVEFTSSSSRVWSYSVPSIGIPQSLYGSFYDILNRYRGRLARTSVVTIQFSTIE